MWPFDRKRWEERGISIPATELKVVIRKTTGLYPLLRDIKSYRCLSVSDMNEAMLKWRQEDPVYTPSIFDCDDFGDTWMGDMKRGWARNSRGTEPLCIGWIHLKYRNSENAHWMNWTVTDRKEFRLIEPQRDQFVDPEIDRYYSIAQ